MRSLRKRQPPLALPILGLPQLRTHTKRGFTMFELVIASGLVLMVLTGAGMVVSNTERIGIATRAKDTATALGITVLERAEAFNCGMQTTPDTSSSALDTLCRSVYESTAPALESQLPYEGEIPVGSNGAGGYSTDVIGKLMWGSDEAPRPFRVDYTTRWLPPSTTSSPVPPCPDAVGGKPPRPTLFERTVDLTWFVLGKENEVALSSMIATPSSLLSSSTLTGDIVVEAPAGTLVVLTAGNQDPSTAISRVVTECGSAGSKRYVAWFPFLRLAPPDPVTKTPAPTTFYVGLGAPGTQEIVLNPSLPYAKVGPL